jgi:hypothetical protein
LMTKRNRKTSPPGIRLSTLAEIKTELATIYRLARRHPERLPWHDATKAAHVLMSLARLTTEVQELERADRVAAHQAEFNRQENERIFREMTDPTHPVGAMCISLGIKPPPGLNGGER